MGAAASAHGAQAHSGEQTSLSGEVVAAWCYLIEGKTGRYNASSGRNCFRLGSPAAIRVGDVLYIVKNEDRDLKSRLVSWAGHQVVAQGIVGSEKGQRTIQLSSIERAKPKR